MIEEIKNKIPITVDNNPNLGYEKKRPWYFLMVLITLILALWVAIKKKIFGSKLKTNTFWFDGISPVCRTVKENAARWKALDIIYNYSPPEHPTFSDRVTNYWNTLLTIRATRNRLRIVKHYLKKEIQSFLETSSEVRIISIASGSAQGVIEVMEELKEKPIKAVLLDLDITALEYSKKLAEKAGVKDKIIFLNKSTRDLEEVTRDFQPHIIEIVGFLMYRPKEKAIKLVEKIHKTLGPNGTLLISNDDHVIEKFFLYYVIDWSIIYRSPKKFSEILIKGGFKPRHCEIIYEPLKMHGLAICRKIM